MKVIISWTVLVLGISSAVIADFFPEIRGLVFFIAVLLLPVSGILYVFSSVKGSEENPLFVGDKAPDFESKVPAFESKVPAFESKVPAFESKVPNFEELIVGDLWVHEALVKRVAADNVNLLLYVRGNEPLLQEFQRNLEEIRTMNRGVEERLPLNELVFLPSSKRKPARLDRHKAGIKLHRNDAELLCH